MYHLGPSKYMNVVLIINSEKNLKSGHQYHDLTTFVPLVTRTLNIIVDSFLYKYCKLILRANATYFYYVLLYNEMYYSLRSRSVILIY